MAAPETEHVRNVALVGQDGAGKTSLAEALCLGALLVWAQHTMVNRILMLTLKK